VTKITRDTACQQKKHDGIIFGMHIQFEKW